jgi:cell division septum initiation protein DivIVA
MAKKDKKSAKKDKSREPADVVDAVRGAVERTFQATAGGTDSARDRGRSLLDDVANAAQRIRESFDDLRVLEDVRGLRAEIEALSRRVAELEKANAKPAAAASAAKPAASAAKPARASAAKPAAKPARKPATSRRTTSARSTTTRKAPAKPSAAATAAKSTGTAKPKPASTKSAPSRRTGASRKS